MRRKIDYYGFVQLKVNAYSPICVAGGEEKESDHDIIRNFDHEFFIPGTSLAGAFRAYCEEGKAVGFCSDKEIDWLFGYAQGEDNEESRLLISDAEVRNANLILRDGIALDENKITLNTKKYDYEALDVGTEFVIEMELRVQHEEIEKAKQMLKEIVSGIHTGQIRIGYKKMRGMGELRVSKVSLCEFQKVLPNDTSPINAEEFQKRIEQACRWQYFSWDKKDEFDVRDVTEEWCKETSIKRMILFTIPLELQGGISIRKYSARRKEKESSIPEVDFEQMNRMRMKGESRKNYAIIPGSTWNGALRHQCKRILQELNVPSGKIEIWLDSVFGYVNEKSKEAFRSRIEIKESEMSEDCIPVPIMRNRINRFDAGTIEGALYTEISYFGGKTELKVTLPNKEEYYWAAGLMILAFKDIANGFLAIGGQTAIGRGIFQGNVNVENEKKYLQKLADKIGERQV